MIILFSRVFVGKAPLYRSVQKIFGIGNIMAKRVCALIGCNVRTTLGETGRLLFRIERLIQDYRRQEQLLIQLDLKEYLEAVLNQKVKIRTYAGFRHCLALPIHGQRTHSNNGTQRRLSRTRRFVRPKDYFMVKQTSRDWRVRKRKRLLSKSERNKIVWMAVQERKAKLRRKKRLKRIGKKKRG